MPDALAGALDTPGLPWLILTYVVAGLVRGFTGFGTALIFMPVATMFVPVPVAVVAISVSGILSFPILVPRAWREGDKAEVAILALAALVTVPLGVYALASLDNLVVRWAVTVAASVTLIALITGWRYEGRVSRSGLVAVGAAAGVVGGLTGLTGPVVILFYLAGQAMAATVRANTILFLAILDIGVIANLLISGLASAEALLLGLILVVPYGVTLWAGQRFFTAARAGLYRRSAYGVIALAIVTGLPIFG